jgi:hypothetical protein
MTQGREKYWWRGLESNQQSFPQGTGFTDRCWSAIPAASPLTMAPRVRIERTISALTVRRLTTWLSRNKKVGTRGRTRTCNLRLRRPALSSIELRA